MKTIFSVIHTGFFYILMFFDVLVLVIGYTFFSSKRNRVSKNEYETMINRLARNWAKRQMRNTGAKINVSGTENIPQDEAVLFVSNHQSYFDIGLFLAYIEKNKGFIAKIGVQKIPLIRNYMNDLNCIYIDRGNLRQNMETILEGIEILKNGYSLVIFPEGTRNIDMQNFKAGSFKLAIKSGVPVVPVTIDGAYKILPKGKKLINRASLNMVVHQPIPTKDLSKQEEKNLHNVIEDLVRNGFKI